jgi:hypothetical protein
MRRRLDEEEMKRKGEVLSGNMEKGDHQENDQGKGVE